MARLKKGIPRDVQTAQMRLDGMVSVDPELDLGNGVTVETLKEAIKSVTKLISEYNSLLSESDEKSNLIDDSLEVVKELSAQALIGAAYKYGRDGNEYEMIGGTRKSDRKRPGRRKGGGSGEMK
ncbi:MAG: hypothetical protein JSS81_14720 [Acidobacteria bacterium]|nr:hypothetical protein [Acidobacteriota bacterium]